MPTILFVCRANKFRSPLAAEIMRKIIDRLGEKTAWQVISAGTWTKGGEPAPQITIESGKKLGLNSLHEHRTQPIGADLIAGSDVIVVMEKNQKEAIAVEFPQSESRIFLLPEITKGISYDIPDPDHRGVNPDEVTNEILNLLTTGYKKIISTAKKNYSAR